MVGSGRGRSSQVLFLLGRDVSRSWDLSFLTLLATKNLGTLRTSYKDRPCKVLGLVWDNEGEMSREVRLDRDLDAVLANF